MAKATKTKAQLGIQARQEAVKTLIERHQEEFDELHERNRVALGLPLRAQGPTAEELRDRIRRQEERLERWKRELERAT